MDRRQAELVQPQRPQALHHTLAALARAQETLVGQALKSGPNGAARNFVDLGEPGLGREHRPDLILCPLDLGSEGSINRVCCHDSTRFLPESTCLIRSDK
jgi:hypothetical protein